MSSLIEAREKGAKKAKRTLPKQKLTYINNKTFYQKSAACDKIKRRKNNLILAKNERV